MKPLWSTLESLKTVTLWHGGVYFIEVYILQRFFKILILLHTGCLTKHIRRSINKIEIIFNREFIFAINIERGTPRARTCPEKASLQKGIPRARRGNVKGRAHQQRAKAGRGHASIPGTQAHQARNLAYTNNCMGSGVIWGKIAQGLMKNVR